MFSYRRLKIKQKKTVSFQKYKYYKHNATFRNAQKQVWDHTHTYNVCVTCYVRIHGYYTLTLDSSAGEQHFDPRYNSDNRQPSRSNTLILGRSIKPYLNNLIIFDRYHANRIKIKHMRENYNIHSMCPIIKKREKKQCALFCIFS